MYENDHGAEAYQQARKAYMMRTMLAGSLRMAVPKPWYLRLLISSSSARQVPKMVRHSRVQLKMNARKKR